MNSNQLLLIDLSAIAHQLWHVSGNEPDPDWVSTNIVARIRGLASEHLHAAVCCDNGKSFRADIDASYKAQRDTENRAPLHHQMKLACEVLKKDGFPVWSVKGFEADDIIATATGEALKCDPETSVLIASSDKDLLQLVNDRVTVKSVRTGDLLDTAAVVAKYGVPPPQMADLLALMGDASDNIKGADKIGPKKGAELLKAHGTIAALYEKMAHGVVPGVTPAMRTSLMEFKDRWPVVASLIALRSDVPIPFAEIAVERTAAPMPEAEMEGFIEDDGQPHPNIVNDGTPITPNTPMVPVETEFHRGVDRPDPGPSKPDTGAAPGKLDTPASSELVPVSLAPVDFSLELEPRTIKEAKAIAWHAFNSRLFGAYGTAEAVLMTILAGRELGLTAMASLRAMHVIENKPCLSADTMRALVLKSGLAEYFSCIETTAEKATFQTQRKGDPAPMTLTFTIDEAKQAGVVRPNSGWVKYPSDMLRARASAKLCRLVYPDVINGLYDPSEL